MKYAGFLIILLLSGCLVTHPSRNKRYSVDITQFKQEELIKDTWVYRHPTKKPTDYQRFLFDSISAYESTAKNVKKSDRPALDALAARLTDKTRAEFKKDYQMAFQPGEGVLEIRIALVDIKPIVNYINPDGNEAVRYDGTAKGTKFEMDCIDGGSGEPVLIISTLYRGEEFAAYENLAHVGNVEKAYAEWSRFFKNRFDQAMRSKQ